MRSVAAILLPILAGALVYDWLASSGTAIASSGTPEDWLQACSLLLPAMLIGIMLVAVVFLPLWSLLVHRTTPVLVHRTTRIRAVFWFTGVAMLVLICGGLTALGIFDRSGAALLFVPGLVLVTTFGFLMDPRRVRGGQRTRHRQG
jgi:hypothetical protein